MPPTPSASSPGEDRVIEMGASENFASLKRKFRRFVFPMTVAFLLWYLLYVVLSAYARDFMAAKVGGNVNVAFIFGLLQFVTTFGIAWWYSSYARREIDPRAEEIKSELTPGEAGR